MERKFPHDQAVYVNTYFFINAGYVWGQGTPDQKFLDFSFNVIRILSALRFDVWKKSGRDAEVAFMPVRTYCRQAGRVYYREAAVP